MLHAVVSAIALGVISTLGDYIWAVMHLRHRMTSGLVHGAVICLCIGAAIGIREGRLGSSRRVRPGHRRPGGRTVLPAGAVGPLRRDVSGVDVLLDLLRRAAVELAGRSRRSALPSRAASPRPSCPARRSTRSRASGRGRRPGGPDYVRNLWSWTVAFFPGFLALFLFSTEVRS